MASDVLSAILGLLAGGVSGYSETKESRRKEKLASEESASERDFRERLLGKEITSRENIASKELLSRKEEVSLKLQADRDNLQAQLRANLDRAASSNAIERDRLALQRDELTANIDKIDKQLKLEEKKLGIDTKLKGRELDIRQAEQLGTGPLGAEGGAGGNAGANLILGNLPEFIKAYVGNADRTPKMDSEFIGFMNTLINTYSPKPEQQSKLIEGYESPIGPKPGSFTAEEIPGSGGLINPIMGRKEPTSIVDPETARLVHGELANREAIKGAPLFPSSQEVGLDFEALLNAALPDSSGRKYTRIKTLRGH